MQNELQNEIKALQARAKRLAYLVVDSEIVESYCDSFEGYYDPLAYAGITDAELLTDIKLFAENYEKD